MGRKMGILAVVVAAILTFAMSDQLFAQGMSRNIVPNPAAGMTAGNYARPRVGLGFNGIPLDGSHRQATAMRRAYRRR